MDTIIYIYIHIVNSYPYMYILIHPIHLKRRFIHLIIPKPVKAIGFLLDHRLVWWSVESTSLLSGLALSENSVTMCNPSAKSRESSQNGFIAVGILQMCNWFIPAVCKERIPPVPTWRPWIQVVFGCQMPTGPEHRWKIDTIKRPPAARMTHYPPVNYMENGPFIINYRWFRPFIISYRWFTYIIKYESLSMFQRCFPRGLFHQPVLGRRSAWWRSVPRSIPHSWTVTCLGHDCHRWSQNDPKLIRKSLLSPQKSC